MKMRIPQVVAAQQISPEKQQQNTPSWRYTKASDHVKLGATGLAAAGVYGLALSQVFNPVALAGVAAYAVAKTSYSFYKMTRAGYADKMVKDGYISPLTPEHQYLQDMVSDIDKMARMKPHTAYIAEDKLVRAMTPWYLRWLLSNPKVFHKAMENTAAALTTMDVVFISRPFIDKYSPAIERFVVAHEMGHAYAEDSSSAPLIVKSLKKTMQTHLLYGLAIAAGMGMLGMVGLPLATTTLPILAGGVGLFTAGAVLAGASLAAGQIINYGSRVMEYRADRNAVYMTRFPDAGENFLKEAAHDGKQPTRSLAWVPDMSTHPSHFNRVANLKAAMNEAAAYAATKIATPQAEIEEETRKAERAAAIARDPWHPFAK